MLLCQPIFVKKTFVVEMHVLSCYIIQIFFINARNRKGASESGKAKRGGDARGMYPIGL
jgi:hypothetical protein